MSKNAFALWQPPSDWRQISCLDCHTGGEPLRIVTSGFPALEGDTVLAQRRDCQQRFDHLRRALMFEPRGHADMYGCIILPPERSDSAFGVLFLHNEGYSTMCGHAMIALAKVAVEAGVVPATYPVTRFKVDAPCGQIQLYAELAPAAQSQADQSPLDNNNTKLPQVQRSWFDNVPSFVLTANQQTRVPGIGSVPYQLAYGGAFYAYVEAQAIGLDLDISNHRQIIRYGELIKRQLLAEISVQHPFADDLSLLYGVIFTAPSEKNGVAQRNVCVFADGQLDRSPTGSGVSGLAALLHQQGKLEPGQSIRIESIVGSEFSVVIQSLCAYGPYQAVIPQVAGTAYVTAMQNFVFDPADPVAEGFIFR